MQLGCMNDMRADVRAACRFLPSLWHATCRATVALVLDTVFSLVPDKSSVVQRQKDGAQESEVPLPNLRKQ